MWPCLETFLAVTLEWGVGMQWVEARDAAQHPKCIAKSPTKSTLAHVRAQSLSRVPLFAAPWTVALQAPLSMGFPRQEYWSGLPIPLLQGIFPIQGLNPQLLHWQADSLLLSHQGSRSSPRGNINTQDEKPEAEASASRTLLQGLTVFSFICHPWSFRANKCSQLGVLSSGFFFFFKEINPSWL